MTNRSLDLSFNNIRYPPYLPSLKYVKVLYLIQNKISRIDEGELDWCKDTLTSLELGGNRIRVSGFSVWTSRSCKLTAESDDRESRKAGPARRALAREEQDPSA